MKKASVAMLTFTVLALSQNECLAIKFTLADGAPKSNHSPETAPTHDARPGQKKEESACVRTVEDHAPPKPAENCSHDGSSDLEYQTTRPDDGKDLPKKPVETKN